MPAFASSIPVSGAAAPDSPPSSAAVLEHVCLFTHDLRRKQKRWQDGRLKFHTFNKRVMVYDERGNFIGDMHWRRDYDFDEGEEIELERGGVIVQVAECVGRREQDLSELLDKRAKEKEQRQLNLAARSNGSLSVRPTPRAPQADHFQVRHRPLHQLIGTPTGHHGRALAPSESPFEQRHSPNNGPEEQGSRAPKRRKYDDAPSKSGYAQALFGATLTLSATPMSSAPIRQRPSTARSPSVEVESHHPSQDQEVLREKSKSSRHFNQQVARKARHESDALKKVDSIPPSRPIAVLEPAPVTRRPQQARSPKADDLLHVNRQPEVITVEDDDEDEIMRDENPMLSSGPSSIPSRQRTGKNLPEKSKKSKARVEPEAIREVLEDQPSEVRPSVPKSKSKSMDPEPEPKRTKSTATESARHGKTLQNDITTKCADTPAKKPEEARTELRIKPRKKRGLLMMSEQVKTTPREPTRPSASEHSTISKPTASNEASDEDDPFGSSPPKVNPQEPHSRDRRKETPSLVSEFTAERNTNNSCPNVDNCNDEDNDISLEAEVTTSKRTRNRRRIILNDDDDEAELLDEPPRKRRARSLTADADIATTETEAQLVEAPKKKQRKSKKTPDLEETNVTETDGNDTTTSRRNPERAAAQRRRRAKEDTPVDVDSSDFGETDEVRERPKKRQRSDELPQVPAGPRLARLSKKSVKSREVIGFVLKDGAMFRGLGTATRPPVQQPVPQQDAELPEPIPKPITTKTKAAEMPVTSRPNEKAVPSKSEQLEPADRSTRTTRPRKEQEPSKNLMLDVPALPVAPKEVSKPSARQDIPIENNGPPSIKENSLVDSEQQLPVPKASEAQKAAEQVEADILEGMTLSPIVLSPVKPSVTTTGPCQDLPVHDTSAEDIPKPPPVPQHTEEPCLPKQLLPSPAPPPERRTINGLGRSNSATSTLQSRLQSATDAARFPEPPQNASAAAKPSAVARIVNPATRGRKAALKSDAAGKVPQSVLPPNPAAGAGTTTTTAGGVTVIYIERPAPPAAEAEPSEPKAVKKMSFPGFAPARQTGPWSREAFDLLEKGRPV